MFINKEEFYKKLEAYRAKTEAELEFYLKDMTDKNLQSYTEYSVLGGGKRVRAVLLLEFAQMLGANEHEALCAACAVEMIHAFSLVHDDLPCMDDDDFRRGKPALHKQFGEAEALLAGDALLNYAYEIIAKTYLNANKPQAALEIIGELTHAVGANGMIGGQLIDIKGVKASKEGLEQLSRKKTGALIVAAVKCGCIIGGATPNQLVAAQKFAENVGLAFQVKDDLLDITQTTKELGKPAKSDEKSNKVTFATVMGTQNAEEFINILLSEAKDELKKQFNNTLFLEDFLSMLKYRTN